MQSQEKKTQAGGNTSGNATPTGSTTTTNNNQISNFPFKENINQLNSIPPVQQQKINSLQELKLAMLNNNNNNSNSNSSSAQNPPGTGQIQ
jgi:hypothetical protein